VDAIAQAWFDRRSSHARDWPLTRLLDAKGASSVSVVLPALNEQATVGRIVERIRRDLLDRHHLVDELVVMDSGSTDATVEVAAAAGAIVVRREDVLPAVAPRAGKGEVLWRSLAATSGDVLVFVDSDLRDFSTVFVTGLLGPLLTDDSVQFVKATYDRALQTPDALVPAGGGRVTELVARPLIALEWPELSWLVQPLAGEWAVRRDLFERLSVPTGYAVEMAALIDTVRLLGPDAIAQVDLGRRAHRPQALRDLGAMAAQILATSHRRSTGSAPDHLALDQHRKSGDRVETLRREIPILERPPAADLQSPEAPLGEAGSRA